MNRERRVVITGMGAVSPLGIGIAALWDGLMDGRCGLSPVRSFDASGLPSRVAGHVPAFTTTDYVPKAYRKSVKLMSRDIELAVVAAYQVALDARLPTRCLVDRGDVPGPEIDPTRFGANIGAGLICPDLNELGAAFATAVDERGEFDLRRWGADGMTNLTPLWLLKFLPNMLACHVTIVHNAQSLSNTITAAEASSHLAIGEAFRNIARGAMDVAICGGAESKVNPMGLARAALMNRLAPNGDADPAASCRPFAANRQGTVASEGAGLVILEALDHARARGARIYAELSGFGAGGSTYSWSEPDPSGANIAVAIRSALRDARLPADQISLAGLFGCGTVAHDAAEINAWRSVLGPAAERLPALAIKGALGNNGAGSGALDLCTLVMALHRNTVPPSRNTQPPDAACPFRFAATDAFDCRIDTAVSVAYALGGGQSAALAIKRFQE